MDFALSGWGYGTALFPHLLSPSSPSLMHFRATRCIYVYCQTGTLSWVHGDTSSVSAMEHQFLPLVSSEPGGVAGPGPCMRHPPAAPTPPQILRDSGVGAMAPTAPKFFVHASLSSNHPCFERQIGKTRRYTNVVCHEVKILYSELFPGSSAVPKLSRANVGGYIVRSFIFLSLFPRFGGAP